MARKPDTKANGRVATLTKPRGRAGRGDAVNPELREALTAAVTALRRIAEYKLERPIARLMTEMGERKEFLKKEEHDLLLAFVDFSERRSLEKLSAMVALKKLHAALPGIVPAP